MYEKGFAYLLQAEHEKVIYGVFKASACIATRSRL